MLHSADPGFGSWLRRRTHRRRTILGSLALWWFATILPGAETPEVITTPLQASSLSAEEKNREHPLRMEGRVNYFETGWKLFWFEQEGTGSYLPLAKDPPDLRTGQRVRLEGHFIPSEGLSAARVSVTVLQEFEPPHLVETSGRIGDVSALNGRMVHVTGYVDTQQVIDGEHVRLSLIVEDRPVAAWIKPEDPHYVPDWEGKFVELTGLYTARFDPTATEATIELWVGAPRNLTVKGSLRDHPGFALPPTPIGEIFQKQPGTAVMVRGKVQAHEAGSLMLVRDASGQIDVHSFQLKRLPLGAEVEATGRVMSRGRKWVLESALYRGSASAAGAGATTPVDEVLNRAEQVRELSLDEAVHGRAVRIAGMVTWSLPGENFFFLQDVTGGIRVRYNPETNAAPPVAKYFQVDGGTYAAGTVPGVELQQLNDLGCMNPPPPKPLTLEQAGTGSEDGQWVQMRGFLQRVDSEGEWRRIHVTTPTGEFVALLKSATNLTANPGSLVAVRGVCDASADQGKHPGQVTLRVPFLHSITVEEDAPLDYYDLPLRTMKGLRQLSAIRGLTRVRIIGTVLHSLPGRALYVQEGDAAVLLLTPQSDAPAPGTRVEAVGILGWEGARIVLRECVYQQIGAGRAPAPLLLVDPSKMMPALDERLVTVSGTLIDVSRRPGYVRLTLQKANMLFEASLRRSATGDDFNFASGTELEVTGIYSLVFDDTRRIRNFFLQLRSPADVHVAHRPRIWTIQRALMAAGVLGGLSLLGLAWITALRRRVRRQTQQIREQLNRQVRLESEVQRAARLESLGELAGGIAHDFNNLLTIIIGNAGLAAMDGRLSATTANCVREIERGAERARNLTRQLLTFAKGGEPVRGRVELADIVRQSADLALHDSNVRTDYTIARDLWPAFVDKDQISQVVHNIVRNAVQAMPHGGVLMVTLGNETIGPDSKVSLAPGDYLKVTFSDSGEGIPAEVLPRIFDPYFTTRPSGSGLGLATVYSIVKRHQGRIEAESTVGQGATFRIWLPSGNALPAPTLPLVTKERLTPLRKTGAAPRVLLMDDEQSIRDVAAAVLQRMGMDPVLVADGGAALREFSLAQHTGQPFELVILDLTIPGGMGGKEAIELIRKLDAQVPVIVSSGYSNDPVIANYAAYGFQAVVAKPYEVAELTAVANRLLGR